MTSIVTDKQSAKSIKKRKNVYFLQYPDNDCRSGCKYVSIYYWIIVSLTVTIKATITNQTLIN